MWFRLNVNVKKIYIVNFCETDSMWSQLKSKQFAETDKHILKFIGKRKRSKIANLIKKNWKQCVVVHTWNPELGRWRQKDHESEASRGYIASSKVV
jgi:hypothetical protein